MADEIPEGHVAISKTEHDATQGELRILKKEKADREDADTAAAADAKQAKQVAAGQFDEALGAEQLKTEAVQLELNALKGESTLRDEVAKAGYTGEKAVALADLVDLDGVTPGDEAAVAAAVTATREKYPAMFKLDEGGEESGDTVVTPGTQRRPSAPSAPSPQNTVGAGIMTREEYSSTPQRVRLTKEFQARAAASQHTWPDVVVASETFERG